MDFYQLLGGIFFWGVYFHEVNLWGHNCSMTHQKLFYAASEGQHLSTYLESLQIGRSHEEMGESHTHRAVGLVPDELCAGHNCSPQNSLQSVPSNKALSG